MGSKRIILTENQFNTLLLREYMDKDHLMPLWRYFNMSDEEKQEDLIWHGWYKLSDWVNNILNNDYDYFEELGLTSADLNELCQSVEYEDDTVVDEIISGRFQAIKEPFAKYLEGAYQYNTYDSPAWLHMDYPKMVKNEWLIHFSNNATWIADKGFKHGTNDFNRLAYSIAGETEGKTEGYDFAYTLVGAQHYAFISSGAWGRVPKYGKEAVIFRASGVKLWHHGDQEEQVIFWGPSAKDIMYLEFNEETSEWFIRSTKDYDNILYKNEDIDEVINWIIHNYDQYRKHIISKRTNNNYDQNYNRY